MRTEEQEREYRKLSPSEKAIYDAAANEDPSASHETCILIVEAAQVVKGLTTTGNKDRTITGDDIVKKVFLEKLNNLMRNDFPRIWESLKDSFRAAIDYLGKLIADGITCVYNNVIDPIVRILDDIFG